MRSLLSALKRLETWQARDGQEIAIVSTKKSRFMCTCMLYSRHFLGTSKDFALRRLDHRLKSVVTSACDAVARMRTYGSLLLAFRGQTRQVCLLGVIATVPSVSHRKSPGNFRNLLETSRSVSEAFGMLPDPRQFLRSPARTVPLETFPRIESFRRVPELWRNLWEISWNLLEASGMCLETSGILDNLCESSEPAAMDSRGSPVFGSCTISRQEKKKSRRRRRRNSALTVYLQSDPLRHS